MIENNSAARLFCRTCTGAGSSNQDLASFLIYRACRNCSLANYFYWYLLIECEEQEGGLKQDVQVQEMYMTVLKRFSDTLKRGPLEWKEIRQFLDRQHRFVLRILYYTFILKGILGTSYSEYEGINLHFFPSALSRMILFIQIHGEVGCSC